MSSAGLIYKYYGKEVINNICESQYDMKLSDDDLDHIFLKLYKKVILEIDAVDNGVDQASSLAYAM